MTELDDLPSAVDTERLLALADGHHPRTARALGVREAGGHLVKMYAVEAPGRKVTGPDETAALRIAGAHLGLGGARGSSGLAVLIVHLGADGDYVLVQSWIEQYMADLAVFVGPAGEPDQLRPGRAGLAPCVWEAAVLTHERDAYVRCVLDGGGSLPERLTAWGKDVIEGDLR